MTYGDISRYHSANCQCYLQYTQPYCGCYCITFCCNIWLPPSCLQSMLINRYPPETVNMALPGGQFGSQQHPNNKLGLLDNISRPATTNDSPCGKHTIHYDQLHEYDYPPSQHPFAGASLFDHHSPFNIPLRPPLNITVTQNFQIITHSGNDKNSMMAVILGLRGESHHNTQPEGYQPMVNPKGPWDCRDTMQSLYHYRLAHLHHSIIPALLGVALPASQWIDSCQQLNCSKLIFEGLQCCP